MKKYRIYLQLLVILTIVQFVISALIIGFQFDLYKTIFISLFSLCSALIYSVILFWYQNKIGLKINGELNFQSNPIQCDTLKIEDSIGNIEAKIFNQISGLDMFKNFKLDYEHKVFVGKTKRSYASWGESVIIKLNAISESLTEVTIKSRPIVSTTIVDYGKNYLNIQEIKRLILAP